jgi:serine/threonine protein phosphatase PrpC
MRIEIYAATRTQQGRSQNEDAFVIGRDAAQYLVLCDGAGNAERAAKRAIKQFETLLKDAGAGQARTPECWSRWIRLLDSGFAGGAQTTFLAAIFFEAEYFGACAGDSRAYLFTRHGDLRILTDAARKNRLGSGEAQAYFFHSTLSSGDILLFLTDGAWTPLGLPLLKRAVLSSVGKHFSELPQAILDAAGRTGRADDMTALVARVVSL